MNNGLQPIFPIEDLNHHPGPFGLTKREYFACAAIRGLATPFYNQQEKRLESLEPETIAKAAGDFADALLKELKK